jgi:methyl-accepting chemotaxis protein
VHLDFLSNTMLDTLANSGAEIDDTPFIHRAQDATRAVVAAIESGLAAHEFTLEDVFDKDYQPIAGSNPLQHEARFCTHADRLVRPLLDMVKAGDVRIIGASIGDLNGYLPTHLSERSQQQRSDPVWNDEHCRNKRILIDDTTRKALLSDRPATLATYRLERGSQAVPVKTVFVPLRICGRRWGNFELAYRDV